MEIYLNKGQTYLNRNLPTLKVIQGRVWVTIEGDEKDYVLEKGETLAAAPDLSVVLQGLEHALILFDTE